VKLGGLWPPSFPPPPPPPQVHSNEISGVDSGRDEVIFGVVGSVRVGEVNFEGREFDSGRVDVNFGGCEFDSGCGR
jgi:hypothetical protein